MVKLEVADPRGFNHTPIYFKTRSDCDMFLYVFRDHMCNVPWKTPVEQDDFPEMDIAQIRSMEINSENIVSFAERNLSWGFAIMNGLEIGLLPDQQALLDTIKNRVLDHADASTRYYRKMYKHASSLLMYMHENQDRLRAVSPYLPELERIQVSQKNGMGVPEVEDNDFEKRHLWTAMVIMFGDYDTNPLYGWIDNIQAAITMLKFMVTTGRTEENNDG